MLSFFRNLSKSIVGKIILVLFVLMIFASFALADISGIRRRRVRRRRSGTLVKVGDEQVTERDFTMRDGARAGRGAPAEPRGDLCHDRAAMRPS